MMILKEKISFWSLLLAFVGILIFGFVSQGKRKEAGEDLLREIESATRKTRTEAILSNEWDFEAVRSKDSIDAYTSLLKRSPFFRVVPEIKAGISQKTKQADVALKEEPKKPLYIYKGKVTMGDKVMVIIEDKGTGKSLFVKEGDMIGDFLVASVNDREVVLKKKGGEEIIMSAVKKEENNKIRQKNNE